MINVTFRRTLIAVLVLAIASGYGCKAKKCPTFDGDGAKHHANYDKKGLVKSKNKKTAPTREYND
jgi:hypothetical protein